MSFPKKYKYVDGSFVVEFTSEQTGMVVEVFPEKWDDDKKMYEIGHKSDNWMSCYINVFWLPLTESITIELVGTELQTKALLNFVELYKGNALQRSSTSLSLSQDGVLTTERPAGYFEIHLIEFSKVYEYQYCGYISGVEVTTVHMTDGEFEACIGFDNFKKISTSERLRNND